MAKSRSNARGETALDVARRTGKVADLMAAEMISVRAAKDRCEIDDLRFAGFSAGEIEAFKFDAHAIAERRYERQAA